MALGADGVQLGTRFLMTKESSAHDNYKKLLLSAMPHSTQIMMRKTTPVRLFANTFASEIKAIEEQFTGSELKEKLDLHLGKYRAKMGMLDGDLEAGELEVGQIISSIKDIPSVEAVMKELVENYQKTLSRLPTSI